LLGQELQQKQVTGQILLADGVVMVLDVRKPEGRKDIKAYLQGDKSAIDIPKSIDAYFGGKGAAVRDAAVLIAQQEGLPRDWLEDVLVDFFFKQPGNEQWGSRSNLIARTPAPFQRRNIFGGDRMFLHMWDMAKQMQQKGQYFLFEASGKQIPHLPARNQLTFRSD
jgi:hypothetical protein